MTAYIILSVVIVSLISLVGIAVIMLGDRQAENGKLTPLLTFLVSLAVGALLSNLIVHLLPESYNELGSQTVIYVAAGLLVFFLLEKVLHWRHMHWAESERIEPVGWMNIIADGIHNFVDGALIAAAYLVSLPIGIGTTIAVALHEIPQELGDYGILRASGFSRYKALLFNFVSAVLAVLGAIAVIFWGDKLSNIEAYILAFASGGFIYLLYLLLRKLGEDMYTKRIFIAIIGFLVGLAVIWSVESFTDSHNHDGTHNETGLVEGGHDLDHSHDDGDHDH